MPDGANHECRHPRCPKYAEAGGYCAEHRRYLRDQTRGPAGSNLTTYNKRFRRMRDAFLLRHPMCAHCRMAVATELDHIVPHRGVPRLFWDQTNWQGLCATCHGRKTIRETLLAEEDGGPRPVGRRNAFNLEAGHTLLP